MVEVSQKTQRPFIVLAPGYDHRSAGIRVLHALCNDLNAQGREAYLLQYQFLPQGGARYFVPEGDAGYSPAYPLIRRLPPTDDVASLRSLIDSAYVIYPEVLQGNPLNAPRVIRYVLNSPNFNGYPMLQGDQDFIVGFSGRYWDGCHYVLPIFMEEPGFHDEGTRPSLERTMDCTYIGKGFKYGDCFKVPGTVYIDRSWPNDKESLALMLRNTRYFMTWDLVTQTNLDAVFCGAIPVVMRWGEFQPSILEGEFGAMPYAQCRVENGALQIFYDYEDYQVKREQLVTNYRSVVQGRPAFVAGFASAVDTYFQGQSA